MLPTDQPYLIGETAFHHEGDTDFLLELIAHGKEIGVNAMKFHLTIDLDDYMVANHSAKAILQPWCLTGEQWGEVLPKVVAAKMDLILLCNEATSLQWVLDTDLPVRAIELHATGLNDFFLLEKAAQFEGTVILGTGGSTIDEIEFAIDFLKSRGQSDIFLMHGFQNYPTNFEDINLSKMKILHELFQLPVGYADHTDPADEHNEMISVMGAAMGFNVLEKHFTHQFGIKRIDGQAAVSIDQMKNIKTLLQKMTAAYGFEDLRMSAAEKKYGNTGPMKKAIVARTNITAGETITKNHIAFKRTNEGIYLKQKEALRLIGLTATVDIPQDEFIDFSKVKYEYQQGDVSQFSNSSK